VREDEDCEIVSPVVGLETGNASIDSLIIVLFAAIVIEVGVAGTPPSRVTSIDVEDECKDSRTIDADANDED